MSVSDLAEELAHFKAIFRGALVPTSLEMTALALTVQLALSNDWQAKAGKKGRLTKGRSRPLHARILWNTCFDFSNSVRLRLSSVPLGCVGRRKPRCVTFGLWSSQSCFSLHLWLQARWTRPSHHGCLWRRRVGILHYCTQVRTAPSIGSGSRSGIGPTDGATQVCWRGMGSADLGSVRLVCVVHEAVGESSGATQPSWFASVIPSPPTVFP